MSKYLAFFGSSEGFRSHTFDTKEEAVYLNEIIENAGLFESKVFTTDDTKNKEILARYFFKANGKNYCLIKLYSFAQASNISRVEGCTYGVALISDQMIKFSKRNLDLLRVAKDNFAKLSLNGLKFNKTNFKDDVSRIWRAVVENSDGNLIEKIETSQLVFNNLNQPVAFYVDDLFSNAIKLDQRASKQDFVYLSEDLEHMKRIQSKVGKDSFPIYWEQNDKFVPYIEPKKIIPPDREDNKKSEKREYTSDSDKTGNDLTDVHSKQKILEEKLKKLQKDYRKISYLTYTLVVILFLFLCLFFFYVTKKSFFSGQNTPKAIKEESYVIPDSKPLSFYLNDVYKIDTAINLLKSVKYIYTFNIKGPINDTSRLNAEFQKVERVAKEMNFEVASIKNVFYLKIDSVLSKLSLNKPANTSSR